MRYIKENSRLIFHVVINLQNKLQMIFLKLLERNSNFSKMSPHTDEFTLCYMNLHVNSVHCVLMSDIYEKHFIIYASWIVF